MWTQVRRATYLSCVFHIALWRQTAWLCAVINFLRIFTIKLEYACCVFALSPLGFWLRHNMLAVCTVKGCKWISVSASLHSTTLCCVITSMTHCCGETFHSKGLILIESWSSSSPNTLSRHLFGSLYKGCAEITRQHEKLASVQKRQRWNGGSLLLWK